MIALSSLGVVLVVGFIVSPIRERAEAAAGYTTRRLAHRELTEVLPGSDIVVRPAGEEYLTDSDYQAAVDKAREQGEFLQGLGGQSRSVPIGAGVLVSVLGILSLAWILVGHFDVAVSVIALLIGAAVAALIRLLTSRSKRGIGWKGKG